MHKTSAWEKEKEKKKTKKRKERSGVAKERKKNIEWSV
jgi:hypothetical protein